MALSNESLTAYIRDHAEIDKHAKLVAYTILAYRNIENLACFPAQSTIATKSGLSLRCTKTAIKHLKDKRVIVSVLIPNHNGDKPHNQYYFIKDFWLAHQIANAPNFAGDKSALICAAVRVKYVCGTSAHHAL